MVTRLKAKVVAATTTTSKSRSPTGPITPGLLPAFLSREGRSTTGMSVAVIRSITGLAMTDKLITTELEQLVVAGVISKAATSSYRVTSDQHAEVAYMVEPHRVVDPVLATLAKTSRSLQYGGAMPRSAAWVAAELMYTKTQPSVSLCSRILEDLADYGLLVRVQIPHAAVCYSIPEV